MNDFLNELEKELIKENVKYRNYILRKYKRYILENKMDKLECVDLAQDIGQAEQIAKNEKIKNKNLFLVASVFICATIVDFVILAFALMLLIATFVNSNSTVNTITLLTFLPTSACAFALSIAIAVKLVKEYIKYKTIYNKIN